VLFARRLLTFAVGAVVCFAIPDPAVALDLVAPLTPLATGAGCLRDPASAGGACGHPAEGLLGAAALAAPDRRGRRIAVASPDADAVALVRRFPSGSIAGGVCVQAPGPGPCGARAPGLRGADALAAPGDDRLLVGARDDHAVVELDGTTERACVSGGPLAGCHGRAPSLGAVVALAVDPSGRDVYAVSFGPTPGTDTVTVLRRGRGRLTAVGGPGGCVQSEGPARNRCAVRTAGLEGADAIAVSPDGRFVYVASRIGSAVVVFARDAKSGALRPRGCVGDVRRVGAGDRPCSRGIPGLQGADAVVVSADGTALYVASADPGAVVAIPRNPRSGALGGSTGCLAVLSLPGCLPTNDVRGARGLVLSADGRQLDVAADAADVVASIALPDPRTFRFRSELVSGTDELNDPSSLLRVGSDLYAASPYDDGLIALAG
jgi:DNA-binding beta-propeller fold protein YncE